MRITLSIRESSVGFYLCVKAWRSKSGTEAVNSVFARNADRKLWNVRRAGQPSATSRTNRKRCEAEETNAISAALSMALDSLTE